MEVRTINSCGWMPRTFVGKIIRSLKVQGDKKNLMLISFSRVREVREFGFIENLKFLGAQRVARESRSRSDFRGWNWIDPYRRFDSQNSAVSVWRSFGE